MSGSIGLEQVGAPRLLVPVRQPILPAAEYERRLEALRARVAADSIVVYGDREHFANIAFLCGFDPRFEEALLVLAEGRPTLIVGTEGLSLATLVTIDVDVLHCPSLGLMGQDRTEGMRLEDALAQAGIRAGARTAVVGWKYFEPEEWSSTATRIAAPAFLVDVIRDLVGDAGELTDATDAVMNPRDGLRSLSSADQIAAFEWAAARASHAVAAIVRAAEPGLTERQAVAAMPYAGEPLSAHVLFASGPEVAVGLRSATDRKLELGDAATTAVGFWGGLCCRAGLIESVPQKQRSHTAEYLEHMAIPYWRAIVTWYESIRLDTRKRDRRAGPRNTGRDGLRISPEPRSPHPPRRVGAQPRATGIRGSDPLRHVSPVRHHPRLCAAWLGRELRGHAGCWRRGPAGCAGSPPSGRVVESPGP